MPIGIIINAAAVAAGGLLGTRMGHKLPERMKELLTMTFGVCAMVMGILSVILIRNMPAVILAVIVGTLIGSGLRLSERIRNGVESLTARLFRTDAAASGGAESPAGGSLLITAIVLFCASGSGIYGSLVSGMDGDHSVLPAMVLVMPVSWLWTQFVAPLL